MAAWTFGFRFLGSAALADSNNPSAIEWPPHPDRIYQALIATACEHRLGEDALSALLSLEGSAPFITAPEGIPTPDYQIAVPTNFKPYGSKKLRTRPLVYPTEGLLTYTWTVPDESIPALDAIAERVSVIGAGGSFVVAGPASQPKTPTWAPHPHGDLMLRVAHQGRFDQLEQAFVRGRRGLPANWFVAYRRVEAVDESAPSPGPWSDLVALHLRAPASAIDAADLAACLRRRVLDKLGDTAHPAVHGHDPDHKQHAAWCALPFVGHAHADDGVVGLGAFLPKEAEAARQIRLALAQIDCLHWRGRTLPLAVPVKPIQALNPWTWNRPARVWTTATAAVLNRHPRRNLTAAQIVVDGLLADGYPVPASIEFSPYAFIEGGVAATTVRPRYPGRPRHHLRIEFSEPFKGPLLIGAERHFGLGLCRPLD